MEHSTCNHYSDDVITIDGDVMWMGSGNRKTGYLLFNYANLEDPPKDVTAKKYTMSYKFSQVMLGFVVVDLICFNHIWVLFRHSIKSANSFSKLKLFQMWFCNGIVLLNYDYNLNSKVKLVPSWINVWDLYNLEQMETKPVVSLLHETINLWNKKYYTL